MWQPEIATSPIRQGGTFTGASQPDQTVETGQISALMVVPRGIGLGGLIQDETETARKLTIRIARLFLAKICGFCQGRRWQCVTDNCCRL
jgi:hypothetical protein